MKGEHYDKYRDLGLAVSYYRRAKGMSQQQLADKMNVNYETISRIENANTGISTDTLFALANALGVPVKDLFSK